MASSFSSSFTEGSGSAFTVGLGGGFDGLWSSMSLKRGAGLPGGTAAGVSWAAARGVQNWLGASLLNGLYCSGFTTYALFTGGIEDGCAGGRGARLEEGRSRTSRLPSNLVATSTGGRRSCLAISCSLFLQCMQFQALSGVRALRSHSARLGVMVPLHSQHLVVQVESGGGGGALLEEGGSRLEFGCSAPIAAVAGRRWGEGVKPDLMEAWRRGHLCMPLPLPLPFSYCPLALPLTFRLEHLPTPISCPSFRMGEPDLLRARRGGPPGRQGMDRNTACKEWIGKEWVSKNHGLRKACVNTTRTRQERDDCYVLNGFVRFMQPCTFTAVSRLVFMMADRPGFCRNSAWHNANHRREP